MAELLLAGAAAGGASLFTYNRENFMFDKEQQLKRVYQAQLVRVKQFELYREDIRDLINLTVAKMDNYLIVNTLQMGLCVALFTEGRPDAPIHGGPPVSQALLWLWSLTIVGAFLYFLLSVWLAMHASIAAHSFGVRMLTQFVRLPVPNKRQLDAARAFAVEYEGLKTTQMLRVPAIREQLRRFQSALQNSTRQDETPPPAPGTEDQEPDLEDDHAAREAEEIHNPDGNLRHTRLYRGFQTNWQAYDAYARVSMTLGTNQLMHALSYRCLYMLVQAENAQWPALGCVLIFSGCAWLVIRLDVYLSRLKLALVALLSYGPPLLLLAADLLQGDPGFAGGIRRLLHVLSFILHWVWIWFMMILAQADSVEYLQLPGRFRSVLYLDVFGWLNQAGLQGGTTTNAAATTDQLRDSAAESVARSPQNDSAIDATASVLTEGSAGINRARNPNIRASLVQLIRSMVADLEQDLDVWKLPDVQRMLEDDQGMLDSVGRLRRRFTELRVELQRLLVEEAYIPEEELPPVPARDLSLIWIRMVWNTSGRQTEFFHRCSTGQVLWERPPAPNRVVELELVEERLELLDEKICSLSAMEQRPQEDAWLQSVLPNSTYSSTAGQNFNSVLSAPGQGRGVFRSVTSSVSAGHVRAFAGRRPQARTAGDATGTGATRAAGRAPPGHMPWKTFWLGNVLLLCLWTAGTIWRVYLFVTGLDADEFIPLANDTHATGIQQVLVFPERLQTEAWPHPLYETLGLAGTRDLSGSHRPSLLLLERYGVRELRSSGDGGWWLHPALEGCLDRAEDFQAMGLRSMSVRCEGSACYAFILGITGRSVLQCPLVETNKVIQPVLATLQKGPWKTIAAATGAERGRRMIWAVKEDPGSSPTLLEASPLVAGHHFGLDQLPVQELYLPLLTLAPAPAPLSKATILQLAAIEDWALLALRSDGRLLAWVRPLGGGAWAPNWLATLPTTTRWTGMTVHEGTVYVTGRAVPSRISSSDGLQVWQFELPASLQWS